MYKNFSKLCLGVFLCLFISACSSGPEQPQAQRNFSEKIRETAQAYEQGDTDAAKKQAQKDAFAARDEYLAGVAVSPRFDGWICKVDSVDTKGGSDNMFTKQTIAIVTLDCDDFTLYNADISGLFSAAGSSGGVPVNAIVQGTPLYDVAVGLKGRDYVKASGKFLTRDGRLHENSLTESGAMDHPDFVVEFESFEKVEQQ